MIKAYSSLSPWTFLSLLSQMCNCLVQREECLLLTLFISLQDHKSERDTHCGMQTNLPCCHCISVDLLCCTSPYSWNIFSSLCNSTRIQMSRNMSWHFRNYFLCSHVLFLIIAPGKRQQRDHRNVEHCISSVISLQRTWIPACRFSVACWCASLCRHYSLNVSEADENNVFISLVCDIFPDLFLLFRVAAWNQFPQHYICRIITRKGNQIAQEHDTKPVVVMNFGIV